MTGRASDAATDRGIRWERHSDLIRTQLQTTRRLRLTFLRLADLMAAVDDLGIDPDVVRFLSGYAVAGAEAWLQLQSELAEADRG